MQTRFKYKERNNKCNEITAIAGILCLQKDDTSSN